METRIKNSLQDVIIPELSQLVWQYINGSVAMTIGSNGIFRSPVTIAVDNHHLFVVDVPTPGKEHRVQMLNKTNGVIVTQWRNGSTFTIVSDNHNIYTNTRGGIIHIRSKQSLGTWRIWRPCMDQSLSVYLAVDDECFYGIGYRGNDVSLYAANRHNDASFNVLCEAKIPTKIDIGDLVVDDKYIYLSNLSTYRLYVLDKKSLKHAWSLSHGDGDMSEDRGNLAVDDKFIYVVSNSQQCVYVVCKSTHRIINRLHTNIKRPHSAAVDANFVYIADQSENVVIVYYK
jgi:hypothetical protein